MRLRIPPLLLLIYFAIPCVAVAQRAETITLRFDNDILALRGRGAPPDYDYTQGLHLTAEFHVLPRPFRRWMSAEEPSGARTRLGVGQRIYTPRQDGSEPVPGERPYAGWLFMGADVLIPLSGIEHRIGVELGVTGPAALGELVQNGFHRLVGSTQQEGWNHQLQGELAGLVRYGAAWPQEFGGVHVRPQGEIGVGTLWSGAAGGLDLRFGAPPEARGLYAEGQVRQEWVARNLFLDGNTFHESVRAEKRAWVSEVGVGIGYGLEGWALEYRFIVRSREYDAQPGPHGYGSVALKWRQ